MTHRRSSIAMANTATCPKATIHINGYPGVGKLSIARVVAERLGGKLHDNHTLLNHAAALFGRGTVPWKRLRLDLRSMVFEAAIAVEEPLLLTDALGDSPEEIAMLDAVVRLAEARGGLF